MIDLELGPVVGQTGGGQTEIITEDFVIAPNTARSWALPDGWESGYIALRGHAENDGGTDTINLFGDVSMPARRKTSGYVHGFGSLPGEVINGGFDWSGTVTMIRTA